jgi:hypothetical protein
VSRRQTEKRAAGSCYLIAATHPALRHMLGAPGFFFQVVLPPLAKTEERECCPPVLDLYRAYQIGSISRLDKHPDWIKRKFIQCKVILNRGAGTDCHAMLEIDQPCNLEPVQNNKRTTTDTNSGQQTWKDPTEKSSTVLLAPASQPILVNNIKTKQNPRCMYVCMPEAYPAPQSFQCD